MTKPRLFALAFVPMLVLACRSTSAASGELTPRTLTVCSSAIDVRFGSGSLDLPEDDVLHWVQMGAESVATYYGRFPVTHTSVRIALDSGDDGVLNGTTWGGPHVNTRMTLGQHTTARQLDGDWTMTHEFIHMAFPDLDDEHHWIEEGLAVYIEPLARVQRGVLKPDQVWRDMVRDMPKGQPGEGAAGLDHTRGWATTYWGGALFFLMADVQIREQTHNTKSLQDAMRAVLEAGQTIEVDSTPETAFAFADKATGTHVLTDLYNRVKDKATPFDLPALWKKLGVQATRANVTFDDHAPDAQIRSTFFAPRTSCLAKK